MRGLMDEIMEEYKDNPEAAKLKNLQVPNVLGGEIDALIEIKYTHIYPELLFTLPNGLQIFKSKLKPAINK